jgi:hypothetical protein
MSLIAAITNPKEPVIGSELAAESFKIDAGQYKVNIDPASNVAATESAAGIKLMAPVTAASAVTTFAFDAVAKTITVAVDGTASQVINVGALDDEGAKLVINGQNLELQNAAGVVLSSTQIGQLDAQQLTGAAIAAGYKLTLSNGGSVTITAPEIGSIFPTAAAGSVSATTELLTKAGTSVKVKRAVSSLGTQLNYWVIDL